jgi:hypothetical protein
LEERVLGVEDLRRQIATSKSNLEMYKSYGQFVVDAINAFTRLDEILTDPSEGNVAEGLQIATELNRQIAPYRVFVPQVAGTIDGVLKWLQERE